MISIIDHLVGGACVCILLDRRVDFSASRSIRALVQMSNGSPPRACFAGSGLTTMVLDPGQPMSCSMQLEGDTMMFRSLELLEPSKFSITEPISTPETDIFSLRSVIHQVCDHDRGRPPFTYIFQVLTCKLPFPGLGMAGIALNAVRLWAEVMPACAQVDCVVPAPPWHTVSSGF